MNIIEKTIAKKAHLDMVFPRDQVTLEPSLVYLSEDRALSVIHAFYELGYERVCLPSITFVHLSSTISSERNEIKSYCNAFGLHLISDEQDVLYDLRKKEELVVAGVDDSIDLLGASGSIPLQLSATSMAHCLGTGQIKMNIPETLYIEVNGRLPFSIGAEELCDFLLNYFNDSLIGMGIVIGGDTIGGFEIEERQKMTRFISGSGAVLGMISPLGPLGQVESVVKIRTQDIARSSR